MYNCAAVSYKQRSNNIFSEYDVAPGSEITSCNKIDKSQVVYGFLRKHYDVHNNVAYIMIKIIFFTPEIRFQSNLYVI